MFPDQVKRVILDGVVFAPEQYTSIVDHGISAGKSTNGVFDGFVSHCSSAGPSRCALANTSSLLSSSESLHHRLHTLLTHLRTAPLPIPHPTAPASVPSVLHAADLTSALFSALYRPASWPALARALSDLEAHDDARELAALARVGGAEYDLQNITDAQRAARAGWTGGAREMGQSEAGMAVSCGDAPPFLGGSEAWMAEWLGWREALTRDNPLGGPGWFDGVVGCRFWGDVKPEPERYEGSWAGVKPKNPILFVSNTYDPITPLASGQRMVNLFGKDHARLLQNDGYGHCSTNHPSICIAKAVRRYMVNGTLPDEGTVCQPDEGFIFPPPSEEPSVDGLNDEDAKLTKVLRELSQVGVIGMPMERW